MENCSKDLVEKSREVKQYNNCVVYIFISIFYRLLAAWWLQLVNVYVEWVWKHFTGFCFGSKILVKGDCGFENIRSTPVETNMFWRQCQRMLVT